MVIDNKFSIVRVVVIVLAVIGLGGLIFWAQSHRDETETTMPTPDETSAPRVILDGTATDPTEVNPYLQATLSARESFISQVNTELPLAGLTRTDYFNTPEDDSEVASLATPTPEPTNAEPRARYNYEDQFFFVDTPNVEVLQTLATNYFTNIGYALPDGPFTTDTGVALYFVRDTDQGYQEHLNVTIEAGDASLYNLRVEYESGQSYPLSEIPKTYILTDQEEYGQSIEQGICVTVPNPFSFYWDARFGCLYPDM